MISTFFYDSKNKIHLYLTKYNDKLRASIYNKDKNLRHSFKVTETKGTVIFEYTHTNDFSKNKNTSISRNDVIEVNKIDSLHYQIIAFKNGNKKRKRLSAIVTLENSKFNYLNINLEHSKSDEMEKKIREFLDPNTNYILKNVRIEYPAGSFYDTSLKIQSVDFFLKIPDTLVIKEFVFLGEFQE